MANMENKYKHMDYVQSAISRMASNSFHIKGWNVTIIAAIVALSFKESDWRIYDKQSNRAPTGTTILNARWSQVYLYTPSNGYGLWGTAATTFAHKTAQTSTLANKVSVSITTKWSEDTTNILYQ